MNLYDASPDDDVVAARIWWRCDRDVGEPFPEDPLAWEHIRHFRETGRMVIAVTEDGEPAGFGGVVVRSGVTRLADLFVDPAHQGRGVGKAILREVLGDASVLTTSASNDPRTLPLYARAGMQPLWPYHFLLGDPRKVLAPSTVTVERRGARRARRDRPRGHGLRSSDRPRVLRGRVSCSAAARRLGRPGDRLRVPRTASALGDEPLDPPDARGRAGLRIGRRRVRRARACRCAGR